MNTEHLIEQMAHLGTSGMSHQAMASVLGVSVRELRAAAMERNRLRKAQERKEAYERKAGGRAEAKSARLFVKEQKVAERAAEAGRKRAERTLLTKIRARLRNTIKGAEVRGLSFELTEEVVGDMLRRGHCERTGIAFEAAGDFAASIDRVDNSRGYELGNVQAVCWVYNRAKGSSTDAAVLRMAEALVSKQKVTDDGW